MKARVKELLNIENKNHTIKVLEIKLIKILTYHFIWGSYQSGLHTLHDYQ